MRTGMWRFYDSTGVLTKEVDFDLVPGTVANDSLK
jgi:hypothetical protein